MQITYDGARPESLDSERHASFVNTLKERLSDPDRFELVIARNFVASVRSRTADPKEAAEYEADRLFGQAVAKTLVHGNGVCLILDADVLRSGTG